ncbi:LBP/BPI/CETP family protein [Capsaspora owczarzaki ATCC 30864]|uniref:LBP/BPI/CETP family protein n=1 Tax=Capsaspora owczarzaki (strain ATCC 30864) TaxID=595528 RepID=A0A0D2WJL9_CAPO3|nr:LBP/BPI/CETP family protein [Capsaspora owczarzaki ATCC 30864]KJE90290.1 LBP/BPI/CETP family protein [Capsaspora owczarzaki ATCC 30864]|eukprot:XP_004364491.1 LBP/BPI/CETP family protein [Capsaspora owczarzaki ATCC 30864]
MRSPAPAPSLRSARLTPLFLCRLCLFCLAAHHAAAVVPGFRTQVTQSGLDYLRSVGVPLLVAQIVGIDIPDISGKTSVDVLGTVSYALSNIKLTQFAVPSTALTLVPGVGITVGASNANGHITANWKYSCWAASDHGSADISVSGIAVTVSAALTATSDGHPAVSMTSCSANVGSMSIDFHGGASWLYNLFSDTIAGDIKSSLNSQLCDQIKSAIDTSANQALATLPIVEPIDDYSEINFALIENPTFTATYLDTAHKGEFYYIKHPVECPFTPAATPANVTNTKMLSVWLTSFIADSAGYAYLEAGQLEYTVTPDQVPASFPLQLNTDSFQYLLPPLYNMCPGCNLTLTVNATTPAELDISAETGLSFFIYGDMELAVLNGSQSIDAFTLNATILSSGIVGLKSVNGSEIIWGNATFASVGISLLESQIGPFDVSVLQSAVNILCEYALIPLLNAYINGGFAIPTIEGITFVDPEIILGDDYIQIDTNINYVPTSERSWVTRPSRLDVPAPAFFARPAPVVENVPQRIPIV